MMLFSLGFLCGVLATVIFAAWFHQRTEKAKRQTFEREVAAAEAKYPTPAPEPRPSIAAPDLKRLRELLDAEAADGLTTAQVVELNAVLARIQKAPIVTRTQPQRKDVH